MEIVGRSEIVGECEARASREQRRLRDESREQRRLEDKRFGEHLFVPWQRNNL